MGKHIDDEKKLYGLINSHHGKRFPFVILWVFAFYFDIIAESLTACTIKNCNCML